MTDIEPRETSGAGFSGATVSQSQHTAIAQGLETDGYAVIRAAIDPAYCEAVGREVVAEYQRLRSLGWKFAGGGRFAGHLNFSPSSHGPRMLASLRDLGFTGAAERHLGAPLSAVAYVGNLNLPRSHAQEMHQDWTPPDDLIVINILLADTTTDNGPTEIVPTSQNDRYTYRTLYSSGMARTAVQLTGQPGDLVIRLGTVWHRGTANRSNMPRPMYSVILKPTPQPQEDPRCDGPIGFSANRYYGRYALLHELAAIYGTPLLHAKRKLQSGRPSRSE